MEDSTVYEVILDFVAPLKVPCYKSKQRIIGLALGPVIGSITDCVLLYDVEQEMVAIVDKQGNPFFNLYLISLGKTF